MAKVAFEPLVALESLSPMDVIVRRGSLRNDGFVDSVCLRARKVSRNDWSSLPSRALLFVPVLRVIAPSCRIQVRNPNGFLSQSYAQSLYFGCSFEGSTDDFVELDMSLASFVVVLVQEGVVNS